MPHYVCGIRIEADPPNHIREAPEQLHPDYPGIIVLKSGVPLDEYQAQLVVSQLLCDKGRRAGYPDIKLLI